MSWEKKELENGFLVIRNGASIKQSDIQKGIPITRIETISTGEMDYTRLGYADINSDKYSDYYLQEGDILMSHINSWSHLGKTALIKRCSEPVIHGMNLLALRTDKRILIPSFAKYYFESNNFKNQLGKISNQSVNQSSFSISKLKKLQIPLPTINIQKQIANILDKADELRKKDQQLLQKYDDLAQSIFIDMFGDPVKNEKGIPLNELVKINPNKSDISIQDDDEVTFVPMANVGTDGTFDHTIVKNYSEVKSGFTFFLENDVLFAKITPCMENGKVAISKNLKNRIGFGSTEFHILRPNQKVTSSYLYHLLKLSNMRKYAASNMTGSAGQKRVPTSFFGKVKVIIPSKENLRLFENLIINISKEKILFTNNCKYSESLFQSLLQKAFTGELIHD